MIQIAKSKIEKAQLASAVRGRGRPKKEPAHTPVSLIRELIAAERMDGRWGSWFGIAAIEERITAEQYQAGVKFANKAEARERALASPGCSPRAQDISAAGGRALTHEDERTIKRHRRSLEEWADIETTLTPLQMRALDIIVVQQRQAEGYVQQMTLRAGLDRLITLWKAPKRKR
ncbi:MAG: hypothetical protein U1E62_05325 [Alsobacter sp.]